MDYVGALLWATYFGLAFGRESCVAIILADFTHRGSPSPTRKVVRHCFLVWDAMNDGYPLLQQECGIR